MNQLEVYNALKEYGPMSIAELVERFYPNCDRNMAHYHRNTLRSRMMKLVKWNMVSYIPIKGKNGHIEHIWSAIEDN